MPVFEYKVARSDGTTVQGQMESDSEHFARAQLEGQGFLIFQLRRKGDLKSLASVNIGGEGSIPLQEFLIFNQELVALIKAGLPILRIWDLLIERARQPGFRAVLEGIRQDVRGGSSTSEALSRHPSYFPPLYIASIRAGEQAGNLGEVLQRYILHLKLMIGLRQKLMRATVYPVVLVLLSVTVIAFFLLYVVPALLEVYQQDNRELPFATQILIEVVETIQMYVMPATLTCALSGMVFWLWQRTAKGRALFDRFLLKVPFLGELLLKHHTVQLSRTLGTVLSGGTPLVEALQIARGAVSNRALSASLGAAVGEIREGATLAASLDKHKVMPRLAWEMLAVGEETGSLEVMLREVADFYESSMDFQLGQLTTSIEPILLLVMGVIIGTIMVVMYLPVFQMAGAA